MDVTQAMEDLALIKRQLRKSQVFRGYRAWVAGATSVLALAGAGAQVWLVPAPAQSLNSYLMLWLGVAIVASAVGLSPVVRHVFWPQTDSERDKALDLLNRLLPMFCLGLIASVALLFGAPQHAAVLPGVWSAALGMALFSCIPVLPASISFVGGWYLLCAGACLWFSGPQTMLSPWAMAIPFGVGQALTALVIHLNTEARHE